MIEDFMMHYQRRVCPDIRDHWSGTRTGRGVTAGRGIADHVGYWIFRFPPASPGPPLSSPPAAPDFLGAIARRRWSDMACAFTR
jgi:hypothetical protein